MHLDLESGKKPPPMSVAQRQRVATISRPSVRHVSHGSSRSVVREQYCACTSAKRTRLEKCMIVVIIVMGFVIVALVSAVGAVTRLKQEECQPGGYGLASYFNPIE